MAEVNYVPPVDVRARITGLRPARDELCRLMGCYRFSSPEYRRLQEACLALDAVAASLAGEPELLHLKITPSAHRP